MNTQNLCKNINRRNLNIVKVIIINELDLGNKNKKIDFSLHVG